MLVVLVYLFALIPHKAINLQGVGPDDLAKYVVDDLRCPGSPEKKLTPDMINDDFCDCPDGFDEPGTTFPFKSISF